MVVIVLKGQGMGHGDDALGARLLPKFLSKAHRFDGLGAICFYNAGVQLLAADSACLQALSVLDESGVELIACGTCVEHFGLSESLRLGTIGSMDDIVGRLAAADKVITP